MSMQIHGVIEVLDVEVLDVRRYGDVNPARYGRALTLRWKRVVDALDRYVPNWYKNRYHDPRENSNHMGVEAAEAIRELVEERDDARAKLSLKTENNYPEWKDSYTKQVVDQLYSAQWKVAHAGLDALVLEVAIRAATDLLRDYHATQHEAYEQRDAAIKERDEAQKTLEVARKEVAVLTEQRNSAMNERDNLRGRIKRATNELTINRIIPPAPAPGAYVDCAGRYW